MFGWLPGFLLILAVGVTIMSIATFVDWRSRKKIEAATNPSSIDPTDSPRPDYVSAGELQSKAGLLQAPASWVDGESIDFQLQLLAPVLATHEPAQAIHRDAQVLITADPIADIRTIIPALQRASGSYPLVIAALGFDEGTQQTLIANHLGGKIQVHPLVGDVDELIRFAEATGSPVFSNTDLQADRPAITPLGMAEIIVSTTENTKLYHQS